jgi:hypothetical protein
VTTVKYETVKDTLFNLNLNLVLLQETKLSQINIFKSQSFLPSYTQNFISLDATHASLGILTAWNPNKIKLISSCSKQFSISCHLELVANATGF